MVNSSGITTDTSTPAIAIPRWPPIGNGREVRWETYDLPLPVEVHRVIAGTAGRFAPLVAAYAKVASVLTGERSISVGYRSFAGAEPRLLQVTVEDGSWLGLLARTDRALQQCCDETETRQPPGTTSEFETVLDVTGWTGRGSGEIEQAGTAMQVIFGASTGSPCLRFRYLTNRYDRECVMRYAGYHLRALELLVRDPAADHSENGLVSPDEVEAQLRELSGSVTGPSEKPFHRLFGEQVAKDPHATAVRYGDRECTYGELDELANRIANCLLSSGLTAEGVVAVNLRRSVEWIAAVIGVLRAGGAYLPVDPSWPIDRLRGILDQAKPQVVLVDEATDDICEAITDSRGDAARTVTIDTAIGEPSGNAPLVEVLPDQLAYLYFTSGSTGEPKGAMCEHAGMMNHLLAKLEDLEITARDMLIQSAPSTFDISLWQAIAPLLVGAVTTVVPADTVRDIDDFIAVVGNVGATVIQVVPSYLEVLTARLSEMDPALRLPTVRHVVVTGEALKKGLVERWFDLCEIPLTNAYGATEASDDTTHHLMRRPPESDSVPVGKPVRNVRVLIVDENLNVVPLGAPGEIAFAGVCVGRGYVNDEKRTAAAFVESRTEPVMRLYRTGDFGRWQPGGVLEFLGRRDEQIKIRGVRVEIGEIENAMLRIDGLRDAAVVVRRGADADTGLVGYYTSAQVIPAETLRVTLAEVLPEYMIPPQMLRLSAMPLTDNSKIDKNALMDMRPHPPAKRTGQTAPRTETEQMLAGVWAGLLGLSASSVDRNDNFFDRGGSSLSAIRLVVKLGKQVSLLDIASNPVLSDLAAVMDKRKGL
ncbi:amino acid adenylation domain-containing protein [Amycolatopsis japonica]|uniref:amino acid adenylation domain-containing protein n=1 Tax=Amycolatopsis japonica TaxID=208439 RepID=UPI0037B7B0C3